MRMLTKTMFKFLCEFNRGEHDVEGPKVRARHLGATVNPSNEASCWVDAHKSHLPAPSQTDQLEESSNQVVPSGLSGSHPAEASRLVEDANRVSVSEPIIMKIKKSPDIDKWTSQLVDYDSTTPVRRPSHSRTLSSDMRNQADSNLTEAEPSMSTAAVESNEPRRSRHHRKRRNVDDVERKEKRSRRREHREAANPLKEEAQQTGPLSAPRTGGDLVTEDRKRSHEENRMLRDFFTPRKTQVNYKCRNYNNCTIQQGSSNAAFEALAAKVDRITELLPKDK